ncbi:phage tail protein [Pedobacter montanisoli]|uniref:Tail fiber protein n=1 Tax=Pedobacter montanisoli TaxID=2923277 RepID=A0ABS9ZTD4_9SPHI|nr:tail fiber protein [Pedobacter montanisoli]MCJ0741859.1 tail fiber protein [Pedobacter montanisoli]
MIDAYAGAIILWPLNRIPMDWHLCDGSLLNINEYQLLYALLGTRYGGDGRTNFALPDLRGRVPIGAGQGPGLTSRVLAQTGGEGTHTLTLAEMPAHIHTATAQGAANVKAVLNVSSANASQTAATANATLAIAGSGSGRSFSPVLKYGNSAPTVILNSKSVTLSGDYMNTGTGSGASHNNVQPSFALNFIICTNGLYPDFNQ